MGRRNHSSRRQARDAFGRFAPTSFSGVADSTSTPPPRRWTSTVGAGSSSTKWSSHGTCAGFGGPSSGKRLRRSSARLAFPSSGKHPRRSSAGLAGASSGKRPIPPTSTPPSSRRTSTMGPIRPTTNTGPSHRASFRARGPSSSMGPESSNLHEQVIIIDSDSDDIVKQAPAREKGKQGSAREKGKQASVREKGKQATGDSCIFHAWDKAAAREKAAARKKANEAAARVKRKRAGPSSCALLLSMEKKLETQVTFRFEKIRCTVRYSDDTDDENEAMALTKSKLAQKAEELRVALKWRSKYGASGA